MYMVAFPMTMDIMVVTPATMVAPTMQEAIIVVDTIATAATLDTVMVVVIKVLPSPAVGFTAPRSPTAGRYLTAAAPTVAIIIKVSVASKLSLGTIDGRVTPKIRALYEHWVTKGTTYLVRDVMLAQNARGEWGEIGITRAALVNSTQCILPYLELSYNSERFRPLEEKPGKVEELEEALKKTTKL
jgi:hypothetical protein